MRLLQLRDAAPTLIGDTVMTSVIARPLTARLAGDPGVCGVDILPF